MSEPTDRSQHLQGMKESILCYDSDFHIEKVYELPEDFEGTLVFLDKTVNVRPWTEADDLDKIIKEAEEAKINAQK